MPTSAQPVSVTAGRVSSARSARAHPASGSCPGHAAGPRGTRPCNAARPNRCLGPRHIRQDLHADHWQSISKDAFVALARCPSLHTQATADCREFGSSQPNTCFCPVVATAAPPPQFPQQTTQCAPAANCSARQSGHESRAHLPMHKLAPLQRHSRRHGPSVSAAHTRPAG